MLRYRNWFLFFVGTAIAVVLSVQLLALKFAFPLAPVRSYVIPRYALQDITAAMAGMRRLGADIAWIQLLQYYGSPETPLDKDASFRLSWDMTKYLLGKPVEKEVCHQEGCTDAQHYHPATDGGIYQDMLRYCSRVSTLDPFFYYVYLYGAGALAWNLNRPDDAVSLLKQGITAFERFRPDITRDVHHPFWQLHLYMSAIIYRKAGQTEKMVPLLEVAAAQQGAPNMIKSVLANIYQRDHRYAAALKLWLAIYDSGDPSYRARAEEKIRDLGPLVIP